jgi:hypothetical protein
LKVSAWASSGSRRPNVLTTCRNVADCDVN